MTMKNATRWVLWIAMCIALVQCGKKKKAGQEISVQSEKAGVEVTIPRVSWEKSLAVLPLQGESGASEDSATYAVMTEDLVSHLAGTKKLKLFSPSLANWIEKNQVKPDYLLKGKTKKKDDGITMNLNLVDAKNGSLLWQEEYEGVFDSLLSATENASTAVLHALGYETKASKTAPRSSKVWTEYQKGKLHLAQGTKEKTDWAIQQFKEVLRSDSTFAPAWEGLAQSYLQIVENRWDRHVVWLRLAQQASLKAIQSDSTSAEGHVQLGRVYLGWGDFVQAEKNLREALRINPNSWEAWSGLGKVFIHYGLYDPCLEVYQNALHLNPVVLEVSLSKAMILIGLTRYKEAEEEIQKTQNFYPDTTYLNTFLALAHYYQGNLNNASREVQKGMKAVAYRPLSHAVFGMILARQGKPDEALEELELHVKPYVDSDGSLATAVAAIHSLLKQNGQAIQWLEKAFSWGYQEYPWLANDPNFKNLATDERFQNLMEKIKQQWETNARQYREFRPLIQTG